MDSAGPLVAELQSPPGPPPGAYSALVSNFHPDAALWQRALDVGVDTFFSSANDLVVPSEGGWRTDRDGAAHVPAARIGCFGPGGNLRTADGSSVTHVNFFERAETAAFLARALAGHPQGLHAIDPGVPLPDRRFTRSAAAGAAVPPPAEGTAAAPLTAPSAAPLLTQPPVPSSAADDIDAFHIVIMDVIDPDAEGQEDRRRLSKYARVLATYGGARVTTTMRLRAEGAEPKTLFSSIINFHERIDAYTNREQGSLPTDEEMMTFGGQLFDTLFQGDVRRLYDEARSRQRGHKLDLGVDLDDPVDRREAVGVRLRHRAQELPRDRGDPLRPQRADQCAGGPPSSPAMARCGCSSPRRSRSASASCRSTRRSRSSAAASSR